MTFAGATLGLSLGILGAAPAVDVAVGVRAEAGGGLLPISAAEPSAPATQNTLDARVGLRVLSPRDSLLLRVGPRVLYILPNFAELNRPLVFGTASATYDRGWSRTIRMALVATGGVGELSYASVLQSFAPGTGVADARIVPLATANGSSAFTWLTTRLLTIGWTLQGGVQDPLGSSADPATPPPLPRLRTFGTGLTGTYQPSGTDSLSVQAGLDAFLSDFGDFFTGRAGAGWSRNLATDERIGVNLGAEAVRTTASNSTFAFPNGSFDYQKAGGDSERRWTVRTSAGIRGFLDRLNFLYVPQGFTSAAVTVTWSSLSNSTWSVFGSTSLTEAPAATSAFETFVGFDFEHRRRLLPSVDLVLGVRSALRGGHLTTFGASPQTQLLGFLGFDWSAGTEGDNGRFVR